MINAAKPSAGAWSQAIPEDRNLTFYGSLGIVAACLLMLLALVLSGCSDSRQPSPVNASIARESLKAALDHWKKGEDPKSLLSSATPITAQDFEWSAGAKLLDYQILDEGRDEGSNLRVQVKITLAGEGKNKPVEKKASYVVATSPSVTVYRDVMRR